MQKKCVRSFLFLWVWAHPLPNKKRKKRSPLSSFFLRFWSSKKKSFRRWDARKEALKEVSRLVFLTFYTITSSSTMAASSLTAAALGSKVAFANKVRLMNNASFRLWLFFLFLVSFRARALHTEGHTWERDNFLCKILSSLPVHERNTLLPKRGKGATKRILFLRRVRVSRRERRSFCARMKDLISISRLVLGSSILRPFEEKKSAMNGWWWEVDVTHFLGKDQISLGSTFHSTRSSRV